MERTIKNDGNANDTQRGFCSTKVEDPFDQDTAKTWKSSILFELYGEWTADERTVLQGCMSEWIGRQPDSAQTSTCRTSFKEIQKDQESDIRIQKQEGKWWSALGINARKPEYKGKPTLIIGGASSSSRTDILHQLGHVLGFKHEFIPGIRFNVQALFRYVKQETQDEWTHQDIHDNILQPLLRFPPTYTIQPATSIMAHALPDRVFRINRPGQLLELFCDGLTEQDYQRAAKIYGPESGGKVEVVETAETKASASIQEKDEAAKTNSYFPLDSELPGEYLLENTYDAVKLQKRFVLDPQLRAQSLYIHPHQGRFYLTAFVLKSAVEAYKQNLTEAERRFCRVISTTPSTWKEDMHADGTQNSHGHGKKLHT